MSFPKPGSYAIALSYSGVQQVFAGSLNVRSEEKKAMENKLQGKFRRVVVVVTCLVFTYRTLCLILLLFIATT